MSHFPKIVDTVKRRPARTAAELVALVREILAGVSKGKL
jgi:hypothetical protein